MRVRLDPNTVRLKEKEHFLEYLIVNLIDNVLMSNRRVEEF